MSLGEQGSGLFRRKRLEGELVDTAAHEMAESVMRLTLHGTAIGEFQVEKTGDGKARGYIVNELSRKEVGEGPLKVLKAISEVYDEVLEQLSHAERVRPVEEAYNSVREGLEKVEGLVDTLVLKGRPEGRCRICPGAILQDSPRT